MEKQKKEILEELKEKYEMLRKDYKIKAELEEVNKCFSIVHVILSQGFVSEDLLSQMNNRVSDFFMNWSNYLHSLVLPNPHNMINVNENKFLNEEDRKEILKLISKTMVYASKNTLLGLKRSAKEDAQFLDDSVKFWNHDFSSKAILIAEKISEGWKKSAT